MLFGTIQLDGDSDIMETDNTEHQAASQDESQNSQQSKPSSIYLKLVFNTQYACTLSFVEL